MKKIFRNTIILILLEGFLFSLQAKEVLCPIDANGIVDIKEIGGNGLNVISLWVKNGSSPVSREGNFKTKISNLRPQKLSLVDASKKIRALTIAVPQDNAKIIFNCESTAAALLFKDISLFGSSQRCQEFTKALKNNAEFQALVAYLRKNLKERTLEELALDSECLNFVDKCNKSIFGQDQNKINNSLQIAKKELGKLLAE